MVAVEDVPSLDFDGDEEVVEEGEGEVESGRVCVQLDCAWDRERSRPYLVDAEAMFWLAAKCVIS